MPCAIGSSCLIVWAYLRLRPPQRVLTPAGQLRAATYHAWAYRHLAYSDLLALYHTHHLAGHALPYLQVRIEYPVLTGIFMWLAAWAHGAQGYFLVSTLGLYACGLVCVWALSKLVPGGVAWFAFSPLLLVYSLLNWDLLAIAAMLVGYYTFTRHRLGLSGVAFALGTFAKLFPLLAALFVALAVSRDGDRKELRRLLGPFAITSAAVNVPFAVANPLNWADFFAFNASRPGSSGLLHAIAGALLLPVWTVDGLGVIVGGAVLGMAGVAVWRGMAPAQAAAFTFALLLLLNKVYSPQYMLWMLVFAILAEWPPAALVALTTAGLVDYVNSFSMLHLVATHSPAESWYFGEIFPLGGYLRYGAIVTSLIFANSGLWGASSKADRNAPGVKGPPVGREDSQDVR